MPKESFKPSDKLAQAFGLVLESEPSVWGASEHMAMLRYLVLACSDKAKLSKDELSKLPEGTKIVVDWQTLKEEFSQSGKLAECSNFYKTLTELGELEKKASRKGEYA